MCQCSDPLARQFEFDLKRRIWMAENVPDDHVVWPAVCVAPVIKETRGWGLSFATEVSDTPLGSYKTVAPFADGYDFDRLTTPIRELDEEGTQEKVERLLELVAGRLVIVDDLHAHFTRSVAGRD